VPSKEVALVYKRTAQTLVKVQVMGNPEIIDSPFLACRPLAQSQWATVDALRLVSIMTIPVFSGARGRSQSDLFEK
jgi:hypothetical protein